MGNLALRNSFYVTTGEIQNVQHYTPYTTVPTFSGILDSRETTQAAARDCMGFTLFSNPENKATGSMTPKQIGTRGVPPMTTCLNINCTDWLPLIRRNVMTFAYLLCNLSSY